MTVSFAVAGQHPERIRALLELVRPAVDETVVAVDDRVGEDELAVLDALADHLLRFEYAEPFERVVAWLHGQCSGDWIFRLDDDEAPSQELLDGLAKLTQDERLTHYWLPCRWLFPDDGRYLAEPPWVPDRHLRLVRRDARFVRFPGVLHVPVRAEGPGAWVDPPFYHLALLLHDRDARARKALQYERGRPGLRVAGRALNEAFYLPESRPAARTLPVLDADRRLVRSVLEPQPETPLGTSRPLRRAARHEIDAVSPAGPLPDDAYRAELEPLTPLDGLVAGDRQALEVRVRNAGSALWPWGEGATPAIRLAYHWVRADGTTVVHDGLRTPLPHDLEPGQSCVVPLTVEAPPEPGPYLLDVDLVHEGARWFGADTSLPVEIRPRQRLALLVHRAAGEDEEWDERVASLLAECSLVQPESEVLLVGPRPAELEDRFGHPAAPGPRDFLLARTEPGRRRLRALSLLTLRTARLLAGWRLPEEPEAFRRELARCQALLVDALPRGGERRDRWVQWAAARTARRLGVQVRRVP